MQDDIKAKRTAKNSVFIDLFGDKKNLLKLYKTLHPEDEDATEDVCEIVTIDNVLTDNLYNDLGVLVRHDKILLLLEAQSSWTVNILPRMLLYVAHSYHEYFEKTEQSLYRSTKVKMPKPELYVIYTGDRGKKPDVISLSGEFFAGEDICIEVKAKVFYENNTNDIINQYIMFCKVFNKQVKKYGMTKQAIMETIRICMDRDILREYLTKREKEVVTIMLDLFDNEQILKTHWKDKEKGLARETAEKLIKKGKMSLEEISECVSALSFADIKEIAAGIKQ